MIACQKGENNIVKLLLDNSERIELNVAGNYGSTAFMIACQDGHKDVVQLFLDYSHRNIDLNVRDNWAKTPFINACLYRRKEVVKLLLEYPELVNINMPEKMIISEEIKNLIEIHSMKFQK